MVDVDFFRRVEIERTREEFTIQINTFSFVLFMIYPFLVFGVLVLFGFVFGMVSYLLLKVVGYSMAAGFILLAVYNFITTARIFLKNETIKLNDKNLILNNKILFWQKQQVFNLEQIYNLDLIFYQDSKTGEIYNLDKNKYLEINGVFRSPDKLKFEYGCDVIKFASAVRDEDAIEILKTIREKLGENKNVVINKQCNILKIKNKANNGDKLKIIIPSRNDLEIINNIASILLMSIFVGFLYLAVRYAKDKATLDLARNMLVNIIVFYALPVVLAVLYTVFGREVIKIKKGKLVYRKSVFGIGKRLVFKIGEISDIQENTLFYLQEARKNIKFTKNSEKASKQRKQKKSSSGSIIFRYKENVYKIAKDLPLPQARFIIRLLKQNKNFTEFNFAD